MGARRRVRSFVGVFLLAATAGPGAARALEESCREWRAEHRRFTAEVLRAWLRGTPQHELDEAVFELLQREAWLSSCDLPLESARSELVGWRVVGRAPDDYAGAVVESVLERADFDPALGHLFRRAQPEPLPAQGREAAAQRAAGEPRAYRPAPRRPMVRKAGRGAAATTAAGERSARRVAEAGERAAR
jgi:hypothetical protein